MCTFARRYYFRTHQFRIYIIYLQQYSLVHPNKMSKRIVRQVIYDRK